MITFIFISFAIETISSALHFSSLVLLSSMQTFLLESNISNH